MLGGRLPPRCIGGGPSHVRPVERSRRRVVDQPGVLRCAAKIFVMRSFEGLAHGGSQLSLPTPPLAWGPPNACKKQSARGRYVNEPLIAPLDPRHHPSAHPPIDGPQGRRRLARLRSLPKLLRRKETFKKVRTPSVVAGDLLRGHDRQSLSLTVVLGIGIFEDSKNKKICARVYFFGLRLATKSLSLLRKSCSSSWRLETYCCPNSVAQAQNAPLPLSLCDSRGSITRKAGVTPPHRFPNLTEPRLLCRT
jgi:hypothetical protein